jgi:hypothetical protein
MKGKVGRSVQFSQITVNSKERGFNPHSSCAIVIGRNVAFGPFFTAYFI